MKTLRKCNDIDSLLKEGIQRKYKSKLLKKKNKQMGEFKRFKRDRKTLYKMYYAISTWL